MLTVEEYADTPESRSNELKSSEIRTFEEDSKPQNPRYHSNLFFNLQRNLFRDKIRNSTRNSDQLNDETSNAVICY